MRIIFLGSGAFALPTLRWLAECEHEIAMVVTQPARPSGRGRKPTPTPTAQVALELGLTVREVENINEPAIVGELRTLRAALGVVIAFGQKLRDNVLDSTPGGFINLHASLLPKYRGAAPINWAIMRGEEITGCTVFRIVERMDAGPMLTQRETTIGPEETAGELHDRLSAIGVDAMKAALDLFDGGHIPPGDPQEDVAATLAPKLSKADGFLRFDRAAQEVVRHVHGVTPWPGASAQFRGYNGRSEPVLLTRVRVNEMPDNKQLTPGVLDERLLLAATDRFIEVLEIKPASGRAMSWQSFVNGRRVKAGDRFVPPTE